MTFSWLVWAGVTTLLWGMASVVAKLGLARVDPFIGLSVRTAGVAVALVLTGLAAGKFTSFKHLDTRTLILLLGEGILASYLGHLTYFYALKTGRVSSVVPITAAFPLVAMLAAILVLGERITLGRTLGSLLIVLGAYLIKRF